MNLAQLRARLDQIMVELRSIHEQAGDGLLTPDQQTRFDALLGERGDIEGKIRSIEQRNELFAIGRGTGGGGTEDGDGSHADRGGLAGLDGSGNGFDRDPFADPRDSDPNRRRQGQPDPWDLSRFQAFGRAPERVAAELRARALAAAEQMPGVDDARRQRLTQLIVENDDEQGNLSRHVLIASNPDYLRAFAKGLRGMMWDLTDREKAAMRDVVSLVRAMSITDAAGGYLIPQQLDPTIIPVTDGTFSPMRQISTLRVATSDVWYGVSSTDAAWSYDTEGSEVSDDTTTFAQPSITLYEARGFIPISIKALSLEPNVTAIIGQVLGRGRTNLEGSSFITGTGSAPQGIVTALTAGTLTSATTDTFAIADVYTTHDTLPQRYRGMGRWLANNKIYTLIRQFDTSGGAGLWEYLGNGLPATLLGKPHHEAEAMDGVINATADNYVLIFGDFANYYIVDRMGMVIESIPHLFSTSNGRPTGQRGFYAYCMHGADSVNDNGFEMMNVT